MAQTFDDLFDRTASKKQAKEIKENQAKRGTFKFWKPEIGTSVFRILPPGSHKLLSRGLMGKLVWKHFLYWDKESHGIFTSGALTDPDVYDYCPIQDALDRVQDLVPDDQFKRLKAKPRAFFNILLRKALDENDNPVSEDQWGKVLLCEAPSGLYEFVHTAFNNDQIGFFVHPHEGADVIVIRSGKGIDTNYSYQVQPGKWTPIIGTIAETDKLCEKLTDLDKFTVIKEEVRKKQIAAASDILKWAGRFGTVDVGLGSTDANLDRLISFAEGKGEEASSPPAPVADKPAEPDKRDATLTLVAPPTAATPVPVTEPPAPATPVPVTELPALAPAPAGAPEIGENGMPVCYSKFKERNPGAENNDPSDAQCQVCNFKLPCAIDA
jgi:hypothetical protein